MPRLLRVWILGFASICSAQAQANIEPLLERWRSNPADWQQANQVALAYTEAQQFENAAAFYRKVLAINPGWVPARKNLGVVLWYANRKAESEKVFRSLLTVLPKDPVPHLYIGLALWEKQDYARAKLHFEQAGSLAAENPEVLPAVVETNLETGGDAIVPAVIRFAHKTADGRLALKLAEIFNRFVKYQATIDLLEGKFPTTPEANELLAKAWDGRNQPDRAFAILKKVIEQDPGREKGYVNLAAFASEHQNREYALEVIGKGLKRNPSSAVLHLMQGLLLALTGEKEKADQSLRRAGEADPKWSAPLLALGVMHLESGEAEAALTDFRAAIRLSPRDPHGYYFAALALNRSSEQNRPEAVKLLRQAVAIDAGDLPSGVLLGQLLTASGDTNGGIAQFERVLRSHPQNKSSLYQLGLAYRKLGQTARSRKYMAAFRDSKGKGDEDAPLVTIMKIVR